MKKEYLISITIGPVQDFIATSRRTRDLWFGSWLLSELSKAAAKSIGKEKLIFPAIKKDEYLEPDSDFNVVNKILAVVEDPDNTAKDCRDAIDVQLNAIYDRLFKKLKGKLISAKGFSPSVFYHDNAKCQLDDLVEFYWAAYPYDPDSYGECRAKVDGLLSARKSTRNFDSANRWAGAVPKSSLDGQRESVILDDAIDDPEIQRIFRLRKKERLCGVGVLKRLAEEEAEEKTGRFASTSHMAAYPLLTHLKDTPENRTAFKELARVLTDSVFELEMKHDFGSVPLHLGNDLLREPLDGPREHYLDGRLIFENRLRDLPFSGANQEEREAKRRAAELALKEFRRVAFGDTSKPSPYFALLLADGDNMGKAIDGHDNRDKHKELSESLSRFALNDDLEQPDVNRIVKEYFGSLVYAGGDDVLAILPLHTVIQCAKTLAVAFEGYLGEFGFTDEHERNVSPTLSVGIAICHHTEPLQESLATMRRAEKAAKAVIGKNALAIILSKRSGADTTISGSWDKDRNTGRSFDERLRHFIQLFIDDALPHGVAHEIRDLAYRFGDVADGKAVRMEALRILSRKRTDKGLKPVDKTILVEIGGIIMNGDYRLEELSDELIVAREFVNAYKVTGTSAWEE